MENQRVHIWKTTILVLTLSLTSYETLAISTHFLEPVFLICKMKPTESVHQNYLEELFQNLHPQTLQCLLLLDQPQWSWVHLGN